MVCSHEGDYTCVATNVAGNSTSVVSVNVQGKVYLYSEWVIVV
jgi:hypothetical protein